MPLATFSDHARKERRNVLAASVVGIIIGATNLVPTELAALGLKFALAEQRLFLLIVAGVQLYLVLSFVIYARSEWLEMRRKAFDEFVDAEVVDYEHAILEGGVELANPRAAIDEAVGKFEAGFAQQRAKLGSKTRRAARLRLVWDYPLPIILGVISLGLLVWRAIAIGPAHATG